MQCRNCQAVLPDNAAFCTNCGTQNPSPNQGVAPTVFAAPPPSSGVPASAPSYPPPTPYTPYPQTNYGEGAPPPPPTYGAPVIDPYGAAPPYSVPQQGQYGVPPVYAQPQPSKGNRGWITAVVIVLVVFALIIGGIVAAVATIAHSASNAASNAAATISASIPTALATTDTSGASTPAPGNGSVPDASQIDANAATMILSAQSSSGQNNFQPVDSKTAFNVGDTIYITFKTAGNNGYILAKWYLDGQYGFSNNILQDSNGNSLGYVAGRYSQAGNGVIGLYWCTQSDCSDAALAQVVTITIS